MSVLKRFRMAAAGVAVGMVAALPVTADTLADALAEAYRNSNLLEMNRALLRATDEDAQQAMAALRPVVNFVASAVANSEDAPTRQVSIGLQASMTVFDFGRGRLAVDAAHETILATRSALIAVEQAVLLTAARAYLVLYGQLQTVQLQRNNVSVINEQLRAARERFELGDSTRTDVAIAQARLAASRSALAAAEGDAAVTREEYNLAVGRYPSGLSTPPSLPRLPATLEEAQDIARRNHPSIIQAQHQVRAAEIANEIARTQRLGTVTGSVTAESSRTTTALIAGRTVEDVTGMLNYSVPLYTAGRLNSVERQSLARVEAQRSSLHQTVAIVQQAVAANWAQLLVARSRLAASDTQVAASSSAYDAVQAEADLGSRTTLDVLNAEQELLDARSSRILASFAVQTAAYALLEAMGQLTVESLHLGIPTYDVEAYSAGLRGGSEPATRSEQGQALDRIMGRFRQP
ncbi:MAG: TolC family outer membrane protein [Rhodobacter sp.]|nr:TolC family outer membrane protein [Paracoccaceae bacterium]MCC0075036.1 TolC family outer membrane protein [Rhodobacter sp.]